MQISYGKDRLHPCHVPALARHRLTVKEAWDEQYVAYALVVHPDQIFGRPPPTTMQALAAERDHTILLHYEEAHADVVAERERLRWRIFDMEMVIFTKTNCAILGHAPADKATLNLDDHRQE